RLHRRILTALDGSRARGKPAVDPEHQQCTEDRPDDPGRAKAALIGEQAEDEAADDRADDTDDDCDDDAARVLPRHDQLGDGSCDQADQNHPEDAHGGPFPSWLNGDLPFGATGMQTGCRTARKAARAICASGLFSPCTRGLDLLGAVPERPDDPHDDPADQHDRQNLEEQEAEHRGNEPEHADQQLDGDQPDDGEYAAGQQPGTHGPPPVECAQSNTARGRTWIQAGGWRWPDAPLTGTFARSAARHGRTSGGAPAAPAAPAAWHTPDDGGPVLRSIRLILPALALVLLGSCTALQRIAGGGPPAWAGQYTIERDEWGVPYIHGESDAAVAFGLGYAQAEDDFQRLEEAVMYAIGRAANLYGEVALLNDLVVRAFEIPRLAREEYAREPRERQRVWDAFVAGINHYLATHPEERPRLIGRFEPWHLFALARAVPVGMV